MQINKNWRQQETHKTYQQMNWKWQGATETESASTPGPLGMVSVWPRITGLPCFSAISISHSCQDRLGGGSDSFSQMMFLCGFVPVQTVRMASSGNSSMTAWDELQKEHSLTTCRPLLGFFTVFIALFFLFVCCMAKLHKPAFLKMIPCTSGYKCCNKNVTLTAPKRIRVWLKRWILPRKHVVSFICPRCDVVAHYCTQKTYICGEHSFWFDWFYSLYF